MNNIGFLEGNVIKYVCRHSAKNGVADLLKARHYIDLLLELEYGGNTAAPPAVHEVSKLPAYRETDSTKPEKRVAEISDGPLHSVRSAGIGDY